MDVSKIISISRKQTSTSSSQITDVYYLDYLNIVYKDVFSRLTVNDKKYTWQRYTGNLVANQIEYTIPAPTSVLTGLKKILNIYINYWDWEIEAKIYNTAQWNDSEYNDYNNPYVIKQDGSMFIYPKPLANVIWWFRTEWTYIPLDLTLLTASASIKLASEYHDVMINGLNAYIFGEKQQFDRQQLQKWFYDEWMLRIQTEWAMDIESWYEVTQSEIDEWWQSFIP